MSVTGSPHEGPYSIARHLQRNVCRAEPYLRDKHNGYRKRKIFLMWTSITVITAFGAWTGAAFLGTMSPASFALIEGAAAGAMLTMIAQTMLPEAFENGGPVVGISTLLGFLAALGVKALAMN